MCVLGMKCLMGLYVVISITKRRSPSWNKYVGTAERTCYARYADVFEWVAGKEELVRESRAVDKGADLW